MLRYSRASKETGIGKSAYVQMKSIDAAEQPADSRTTVELQDGREQTYDPRRANFCWDGRNPAKFMRSRDKEKKERENSNDLHLRLGFA